MKKGLNQTGLMKQTEWNRDARWTSCWFGDEELFRFKARDFNQKAEALSKAGINAVITFGGFHFRWSYLEDWPRLLTCLKNVCRSCHAQGIKVVEHHSAILTYDPVGEKEWENIRTHKLSSPIDPEKHPGFVRQLKWGGAEAGGVNYCAMRQIDPRNGQFSRSGY
ncbi:MAG: hypothetical protein PHW60_03870 [Kiritimatiellae bacterium]|nr:hypothetical protein [Kiritimatiellia bacterium]